MTKQRTGFVTVDGLSLGTGKLVNLDGDLATVEYFLSPAAGATHQVTVPAARVRPEELVGQTRVYWYDRAAERWRVGYVEYDGRIDGRHFDGEDRYLVSLPNKEFARVRISQLNVRWAKPVSDPVAYLAARTTETPFWHGGRREFLRALANQRLLSSDVLGLWSAAVRLEVHQYKVVRQVLRDPIQRYLLADEVGLGKTIEAGAILRQYVIDEPENHRALVVVPDHLVEQWNSELRLRFYLEPFLDDSIMVVANSDRGAIRGADNIGMLIVDEAHHVAAMAFSEIEGERVAYGELAAIAVASPRLLLLSATPVLRNEEGFLAMLHLLDPSAYPLDDQEGFTTRVRQRQEIAACVSDLQPDSPEMFVEDALGVLARITDGDDRANSLIADVVAVVARDEDDEERQMSLRVLREHVGEVYRLHRRLIRNRRATVQDVLRGRSGVVQLDDPTDVRAALADVLERWREGVLSADTDSGASTDDAARVYNVLLRALVSHPVVFQEVVSARLQNREVQHGYLTLASNEEIALRSVPLLFEGESELLDEAVRNPAGCGPVDELAEVVRSGLSEKRPRKTLVFTTSERVADGYTRSLTGALGDVVMRYDPKSDLIQFLSPGGRASVLVCDRRAEEGLNLQSVAVQIVHTDVPIDPGRVEQRIGRVDRFGARARAESVITRTADPIVAGWQEILTNLVQVFDSSAASLQYILDAELAAFWSAVFVEGVDALDELRTRLDDPTTGLEAERKRIAMQDQLDGIRTANESEEDRFDKLDDFDSEDEELRDAFEKWTGRRLQFLCLSQPKHGKARRYVYQTGKGNQTQVPVWDFVEGCGTSVDPDAGEQGYATSRMTFSRPDAVRHGTQLSRVGHAFVDGIYEITRRDDRGVAHMMWRVRPELELPSDPFVVFGFDYLVEVDRDRLRTMISNLGVNPSALERRLDAYLPPAHTTVWVDQDLEPLAEPILRDAVAAPYKSESGANRDRNLNPSRWATICDELDVRDWADSCRLAETVARALAMEALNTQAAIEKAMESIAREEARVLNQLSARIARLPDAAASRERQLVATERELARVARTIVAEPTLAPDAAFAIILSNSDPFDGE